MSLGNWIEIAPHPYFHFLKQNFCILTPLKKEESLIHIVNCASLHRTPVEQRCKCPCWMDMIKSSEFSRSGPFQAHRSRYKLPALQILMLQQYPADCPQASRDLKSPHSESNVQYNVAVDLWHDQSSGKLPDNFSFGVTSRKKQRDTFNILEIFTCQDLFTCFLFCLHITLIHKILDGEINMKC